MTKHTLISALVFVAVGFAAAADSVWVNASSGLFSDSLNWSAGVPGAGDKATFSGAGVFTVRADAAVANTNVVIGTMSGSDVTFLFEPSVVYTLYGFEFVGASSNRTNLLALCGGTWNISAAADFCLSDKTGANRRNRLVISNAVVSISGAANTLSLGTVYGSNSVAVINGGQLKTSVRFFLSGWGGWGDYCNANLLQVSGAGSYLEVTKDIQVGLWASYNRLIVENGALADISQLILGGQSNARGNEAVVQGAGSRLLAAGKAAGYTFIGSGGSSNLLRVADGGLFIGRMDEMHIGVSSSDNEVRIENGGVFTNLSSVFVGPGSTGRRNRIVVNGGTGYCPALVFGRSGGRESRLEISGGGSFCGGWWGNLGNAAASGQNTIWVSGTNSLFKVNGSFAGGQNGSCTNTITIQSGGALDVASLLLNGDSAPTSNRGNRLIVSNGIVRIGGVLQSKYAGGVAFRGVSNDVQTGSLTVSDDAALEFQLAAVKAAPVRVSGAVTFDSTTRLVIDARALSNIGGAKNLPVLTYGSCPVFIPAGNISVVPEGCTVVNDTIGKRILVTVPNGLPTRIKLF